MGMICPTMLSNKEVIEQQQSFQRILEGAVCSPFEGKASWRFLTSRVGQHRQNWTTSGHLMPAGSMLAAGLMDPSRFALAC